MKLKISIYCALVCIFLTFSSAYGAEINTTLSEIIEITEADIDLSTKDKEKENFFKAIIKSEGDAGLVFSLAVINSLLRTNENHEHGDYLKKKRVTILSVLPQRWYIKQDLDGLFKFAMNLSASTIVDRSCKEVKNVELRGCKQ